MDEDIEENYQEDHPDSENDLRFSEGHQDVPPEEEIEYELDFEEYLDEDKENQYEYEGEDEFEDEQKASKLDVKVLENQELKSQRKSIYNLDSYESSTAISNLKKEDFDKIDSIPERNIRYSHSMGVSGIARLDLSPLTQKIIGCVVGENVTTEYPWIYVKKELIEDNIDLHDESSEFLAVKDEIENFPDTKILMGYAPSSSEVGQFYICLTEAGRDTVIRQIEIQRLEQESRVRNAVHKTIGKWSDLGSAMEIDDSIVKNNRPLFEIEIESTANLLEKRVNLVNRDVDDQRDGYVNLIPYRENFENVSKLLVNTGIQAASSFNDNEAQTVTAFQTNSWFQHSYEYSPIDISELNETKFETFKKLFEKFSEQVLLNATWDIYTNDYAKLMRSEKDSEAIMTIAYKEHQNYYDGNLCMDKVINDLSWHPFWTGIAVCAYTDYAKSSKFTGPKLYNEVNKSTEGKHQALLWSFNDNLVPKIIFDSPREVSAVSICPYDGHLVVGGFANGQIAIWHVPGKVEKMEAVVVHTTAQIKYRIAMRSLMTWLRDSIGSSEVEVTAMSSLQLSQKGRITQIAWVPCYNKVGKDGRIISFPDDTHPSALSCQFLTSSEDGTIAFWDLKWQPTTEKGRHSNTRRDKSKVPRPDVLLQLISPYKELDGAIQPDYILNVECPKTNRRLVISAMNVFFPQMIKEQLYNGSKKGSDVTVRRYFQSNFKKPTYEMQPKIFIGTVEGQCGIITWDGYNFETGQIINRETGKWTWLNTIHDGPVTQAVRSQFISDLIMTVGGRMFALWKENLHRPFFWNKSKYRYTACSWGNYRPSVLVVSRSDGTIEIWNFATKSTEPSLIQSLSGGIITGIYNHELPLNPQCVAFCDYNGALRVFLAPTVVHEYEKDIQWMETYVNHAFNGISIFEAWQKRWSESNVESIERKKKMAKLENEKRINEAEEKVKAGMPEAAYKINKSAKTETPTDFIEAARLRWTSMELKRMQRIILEKKGLRKEELERRRAPVLKMEQEAEAKRQKLKKIMQLQDKIFEDTAAFLFPKQYYEQQQRKVPPSLVPEEQPTPTKKVQFSSPEEEIIYNFMEVQAEALSSMRRRPHKYAFQWRQTLSEGMARRSSMDVELRKFNKRKKRYREKESDLSDMTASVSSPTVYSSQESHQSIEDLPKDSVDSVQRHSEVE